MTMAQLIEIQIERGQQKGNRRDGNGEHRGQQKFQTAVVEFDFIGGPLGLQI